MSLEPYLKSLSEFQPVTLPVLSIYLDTRPGQTGQTKFEIVLRKELRTLSKAYPERSAARTSFDRDCERIGAYLEDTVQPATETLVFFACSAANDFFEAFQLNAQLPSHRFFVADRPQLYPLARLNDQYRRYAVVVIDSHSARLLVCELGTVLHHRDVSGVKMNRTAVGGWSQARYQRHVDNVRLHNAKEIVEALDGMSRQDDIQQIVLAGNQESMPVFRDQLPTRISEKIIAVLALPMSTSEDDIVNESLRAVRAEDARQDAEKVRRVYEGSQSVGLGVLGAKETLKALDNGQVRELLVSASARELRSDPEPTSDQDNSARLLMETLVRGAYQTDAKVTFVEDPKLLAEAGGVGALLRYRI
jgi:peptide chain release factor subunit 1